MTILRNILDKLIYNDEYQNIDSNLSDSNVGARRGRNIRDNIFVINAILNQAVRKKLSGIDVQIFDAYKCFDKLWAKECINDVFESGFSNDKLPLLVMENTNAQVAVKTATGTTRRMEVSDVVMQGTVWGSLLCTTTMDKLGKLAYQTPEHLYKYHGVPIPPLGMVDDIVSVTSVENTAKVNNMINTFIEHKKLKLSHSKCFRIHIGSNHKECPDLKVHDETMKESDKEKYLGDIIDNTGKLQETITNRKVKGQGIVAEILAIINEIPLGKHKVEVALKLREAMLINGMLFNSEAWHGITATQVATLEKVDQSLLRGILKANKGTPTEYLYLETGCVPIKWIIKQRRINYLQHILDRKDEELVKKVFEAQKENPVTGDFVKLVLDDLKSLGLRYQDLETERLSKKKLGTLVKDVAFSKLAEAKLRSTKVKNIQYSKLELQGYLKNGSLSEEERNMLTGLRSKCVRGIRTNFKHMYKMCIHCPLKCNIVEPQADTQEHVLVCTKLQGSNMDLDYVFTEGVEQNEVARQFTGLMRQMTALLEEEGAPSTTCCLPGASILDPSTKYGAPVA